MMSRRALPNSIEVERIASWLRGKLYGESLLSMLASLIIGIAAAVVVVMTYYASYAATFLIGGKALAVGSILGERRWDLSHHACLIIAGMFLLLLFVTSPRNSLYGSNPSCTTVPRVSVRAGTGLLAAMGSIIAQLLYAGPQLVWLAGGTAGRAFALLRIDRIAAAQVLHMLFQAKGRVSYEALANALNTPEYVHLLNGLRLIDGVVFLTSEPRGLSMTEQLRDELSSVSGVEYREFGSTSKRAYERDPDGASHGDRDRKSEPREKPASTVDEQMAACFAMLGLRPTASLGEIKRAYRRLIKKNHPDLVSCLGDDARRIAEERAKQINAAYQELIGRNESIQ